MTCRGRGCIKGTRLITRPVATRIKGRCRVVGCGRSLRWSVAVSILWRTLGGHGRRRRDGISPRRVRARSGKLVFSGASISCGGGVGVCLSVLSPHCGLVEATVSQRGGVGGRGRVLRGRRRVEVV